MVTEVLCDSRHGGQTPLLVGLCLSFQDALAFCRFFHSNQSKMSADSVQPVFVHTYDTYHMHRDVYSRCPKRQNDQKSEYNDDVSQCEKDPVATPVGTGIWIGNAWDAPDGTSRSSPTGKCDSAWWTDRRGVWLFFTNECLYFTNNFRYT